MAHPHPEEALAFAATAADEALRSLICPDAAGLDRCHAELARSQACLESLGDGLIGPSAESRTRMRGELARLNRTLLRVRGLLDSAGGFWAGWIRFRNALTDGYTAAGEAREQAAGSRLSVEA